MPSKIVICLFWPQNINEIKLITGKKKQIKLLFFFTNYVKEIIRNFLNSRQRLVGPGKIFEVDESLIRGKRWYGVGRLLIGDLIGSTPENNSRRHNYGNGTVGPWDDSKKTRKKRLYYVDNRKAKTLVQILNHNINIQSTIWSDCWSANSQLRAVFVTHQTVNHSESFVVPITGANTHLIEKLLSEAKLRILKNMREIPVSYLQSHLDYFCSIYENKDKNPFCTFLILFGN